MIRNLPIIVDLDRTLILSNIELEGVLSAIFRHPVALFVATIRLFFEGRVAFKRRIAEIASFDVHTLPTREELVSFLQRKRDEGRYIHLVTGADQSVANRVAHRFDFIEEATGSSKTINLTGFRKREYLRNLYPHGYVVVSSGRHGISVWEDARGFVLAGASRRTETAVLALGKPVEAIFSRHSVGFLPWWAAFRVSHYVKNILVFVALLLSGSYNDPSAIYSASVAFIGLGLLASGTYIFNDLVDLQADRNHRSKRWRPFASGSLGIGTGLMAAPILIVLGFGLGSFISVELAFVFASYLVITLSYGLCFKKMPFFRHANSDYAVYPSNSDRKRRHRSGCVILAYDLFNVFLFVAVTCEAACGNSGARRR